MVRVGMPSEGLEPFFEVARKAAGLEEKLSKKIEVIERKRCKWWNRGICCEVLVFFMKRRNVRNILVVVAPVKGATPLGTGSSADISVVKRDVTEGQTFCDLHTHLHLFYRISHAIRQAIWNFLLLYSVILVHSLINPFLQTYMRLSPSDMRDFSLRDLHTFYLPPYVSIMFRKSLV